MALYQNINGVITAGTIYAGLTDNDFASSGNNVFADMMDAAVTAGILDSWSGSWTGNATIRFAVRFAIPADGKSGTITSFTDYQPARFSVDIGSTSLRDTVYICTNDSGTTIAGDVNFGNNLRQMRNADSFWVTIAPYTITIAAIADDSDPVVHLEIGHATVTTQGFIKGCYAFNIGFQGSNIKEFFTASAAASSSIIRIPGDSTAAAYTGRKTSVDACVGVGGELVIENQGRCNGITHIVEATPFNAGHPESRDPTEGQGERWAFKDSACDTVETGGYAGLPSGAPKGAICTVEKGNLLTDYAVMMVTALEAPP